MPANESIPEGMEPCPVDIDQLKKDQSRFSGRLDYFLRITNPLLNFKSNSELNEAEKLVLDARKGYIPRGTTLQQLKAAKVLYDSAYHPDTGERMNLIGRMSFQVPGGMVITGGLLVYYRTFWEVLAAQWINQSFNALVNYTNRNAQSAITNKQIATAYVSATTGAVTVSVLLNSLVKSAPAILSRWVPWAAVASANCINIPVMRQRELITGIAVSDAQGNVLGKSRVAAVKGISQVTFSRVFMASSTMLLIPIIMTGLERKIPILKKSKLVSVTVQTWLCGMILTLTVPIGCALFPQQSSLKFSSLEQSLQDEVRRRGDGTVPDRVYFNKGL